jgi:antitoxin ParD1/3/4
MSMYSRSTKSVTVTLGPLTEMAQAQVASGRFASVSEVVRAGLRALEREETALDAVLQGKVHASLADPSPSISQSDIFAGLKAVHEKRKSV